MKYRSKEGDVLDALCLKHYGTEGHVDAVLAANPGLAALGPVMPSGVIVTFPEVEESAPEQAVIRLWD